MRSEMFQNAIGNIDDELIEAADVKKGKIKNKIVYKWASAAAAVCLVIVCAFSIVPGRMKPGSINENSTATDNNIASNTEYFTGDGLFSWTERYEIVLADEGYCNYKMGNHIESDMISAKICDSIVQGGMTTPRGWSPEYKFDAEIFSIVGVSPEVAVAVKSKILTYEMKDNGKIIEKIIKDDFYVMYNPEADLTEIKDYIVTFDDQKPFLY